MVDHYKNISEGAIKRCDRSSHKTVRSMLDKLQISGQKSRFQNNMDVSELGWEGHEHWRDCVKHDDFCRNARYLEFYRPVGEIVE